MLTAGLKLLATLILILQTGQRKRLDRGESA